MNVVVGSRVVEVDEVESSEVATWKLTRRSLEVDVNELSGEVAKLNVNKVRPSEVAKWKLTRRDHEVDVIEMRPGGVARWKLMM